MNRLLTLVIALSTLIISCGPVPRNEHRESASVRCYFDDEALLWYYVITSNNGGCYYITSTNQLAPSSFTSTYDWTYSSSMPSDISDDNFTEFELDADLLEPEITADESLDLQTEQDISDAHSNAESMEPEASETETDGGEADAGDFDAGDFDAGDFDAGDFGGFE